MAPYMCQPPTGYDDTAETWVSAGALVTRMNIAQQLAPQRAAQIGGPDFQSVSSGHETAMTSTTHLPEVRRDGDAVARLRAVVPGADRGGGRRDAAGCSSPSSSAAPSTAST